MASRHFIFVRIIFIIIRKRIQEIFLGIGVGAKMSGVDLIKETINRRRDAYPAYRGDVHKKIFQGLNRLIMTS